MTILRKYVVNKNKNLIVFVLSDETFTKLWSNDGVHLLITIFIWTIIIIIISPHTKENKN